MQDHKAIHDHLRNRLINGEFAPGARLQAEKLRLDYDVAASTIRESLFRLSTENLVDFREQRGFRMPQLSRELQHEITQMRILLECEGTRLSIRLGTLEWEAQLSAAHHKLSHIETRIRDRGGVDTLIDLWSRAELEFHESLIAACGSDVLKRTHLMIYNQFRQQLITTDRQFAFVPENVAQHKAILDAALDRDEDRACRNIHDHLSRNLARPLPA